MIACAVLLITLVVYKLQACKVYRTSAQLKRIACWQHAWCARGGRKILIVVMLASVGVRWSEQASGSAQSVKDIGSMRTNEPHPTEQDVFAHDWSALNGLEVS